MEFQNSKSNLKTLRQVSFKSNIIKQRNSKSTKQSKLAQASLANKSNSVYEYIKKLQTTSGVDNTSLTTVATLQQQQNVLIPQSNTENAHEEVDDTVPESVVSSEETITELVADLFIVPEALKDNLQETTGSETAIHSEIRVYEDPGLWPDFITDDLRKSLVRSGPYQIKNDNFPVNMDKRRFALHHYVGKYPNGEARPRTWLVYSKSFDAVYCFACRIFGNSKGQLATKDGFSSWRQLSDHLAKHETSRTHKLNFVSWMSLRNGMVKESTIDQVKIRIYNSEVKRWKSVLQRLIDIIKFLAERNLAFRGNNEKLFSSGNGNFLGLVELLAKFDCVLEDHVQKASKSNLKDHYLSNRIQNEIIHMLATECRNLIASNCKLAKYYSIIVDCTRDLNRIEQTTIFVRYVNIEDPSKIRVSENFIGFFPAQSTTGESLKELIINELVKFGLRIDDIGGQGYDNGANMKGEFQGVQRRILDLNPRALYVPCACHSLNLMVGDAATSNVFSNNLFGFLQELYAFTSASTKRWEILRHHATRFTLKPMCTTRWECQIDNVKAVRFQVGEMYDALFEMSDVLDSKSKAEAIGLAKKLQQFDILMSLIVWYEILFKVNLASKLFQNIDSNLEAATQEWKKILAFYLEFRETGYQGCRDSAEILCKEVGAEAVFKNTATLRPRKKSKQFTYEGSDDPITDPEKKFQVEFFNAVCDCATQSLQDRFELLINYSETFGFVGSLHCKLAEDSELLKQCKDLEVFLSHKDSKDIVATELLEEIKMIRPMLTEDISDPLKMLQYIYSNNYEDVFVNLVVLLRIYLTLPVTVASGERSFSKLRLIKTFTTMLQDRLSDLAQISIEHEIVSELNIEHLISVFVQIKARKVHFN